MLGKRLFDVFVSAVALVLLSPLLLAVGVAIRIRMGSPVFFRQQRPGLQGCPFEVIKFRTMIADKENRGVASDAQRLTRLGRLLRATSIDELPELWNVLKGDMSLVGPRPLLMQYLPRYSPEQARRHDVRPGLTGWAQVQGRNLVGWEEKFAMDVWYVNNRSFLLDLKILAMTAWTVVARRGVAAEGSATMHEFMGSRPGEVEPEAKPE
jgi:lipopolysaccharide/colanic/teichoic acid biosynthesis glycosyltransferase